MDNDIIRNLEEISKDDFGVEEGVKRFRKCAEFLINECILETVHNTYRFTELEFYKHSPNHLDGFSHTHDAQLEFSTWYFHPYGLDITFGNREETIYGGILIRGLKCEETGKFISGPTNTLDELVGTFKHTNVLSGNCVLKIVNVSGLDKMEVLEGVRIGVQKMKKEFLDREVFLKANYRFKAKL